MLFRLTVFTDDTSGSSKPKDSFNPLFKAIVCSGSWVRKLVNFRRLFLAKVKVTGHGLVLNSVNTLD